MFSYKPPNYGANKSQQQFSQKSMHQAKAKKKVLQPKLTNKSTIDDKTSNQKSSIRFPSAQSRHKGIKPPIVKNKGQTRERMPTSNYEFPEFAIYSKDKEKRGKTIDNSTIGCKGLSARKYKNEAGVINKKKILLEEKYSVDISFRGQPDCEKKEISRPSLYENSLVGDFKESIKKIFTLLDIFGRGKISQANVNKWIPETALYFLGSVFQRLKTNRLALSLDQFINLCMPLLDDSHAEDIKDFVKVVQTIKQPLEQELSPIEKRVLVESLHQSKRSQVCYQKENLLGTIEQKTTELSQKLIQIQQKRKNMTFHPLHEVSSNHPSDFKVELSKTCSMRFSQLQNPLQNNTGLNSVLKKSIKFSSISRLEKTQNKDSFLYQQREGSPIIANFTFKLPQQQTGPTVPSIKMATSFCDPLQDNLQACLKIKMDRSLSYEKSQSAKMLQGQVGYLKADSKVQTQKRINDSDDERLARLSRKIEEYMAANANKLEKTRIFRNDNSFR